MAKKAEEKRALSEQELAHMKNWDRIFRISGLIYIVSLLLTAQIYRQVQTGGAMPSYYPVLFVVYAVSFVGIIVGFWGKIMTKKGLNVRHPETAEEKRKREKRVATVNNITALIFGRFSSTGKKKKEQK